MHLTKVGLCMLFNHLPAQRKVLLTYPIISLNGNAEGWSMQNDDEIRVIVNSEHSTVYTEL